MDTCRNFNGVEAKCAECSVGVLKESPSGNKIKVYFYSCSLKQLIRNFEQMCIYY